MSMRKNGTTINVTIIDDRLWASISRDVFSVVSLVAVIGLGVYLQSSAMQWVGAIIWFLMLASKVSGIKEKSEMTIQEARKFLDEIEAKN